MIIDSRASLSIYSDTHTAADVTRLLGIEPTKSAERGDPRGKARPDGDGNFVHRFHYERSVWTLEAPDGEGDSFSSLLRLAEMLRGKAGLLAELRANYGIRIWYFGISDSTQAGFVFPPEVLAELAELGCDLYGDVYLSDDHHDGRVTEQAILPIKPGREAEFEVAFDEARWIVHGMDGCREVTLSRGVENPSTYLLLVRWDTVEDHEIGFRGSPEYEQWRALLHDFYEPFPVVEHFVEVSRTLA